MQEEADRRPEVALRERGVALFGRAGLSQVRLATAAELASSTIERIESGARRTRRSTLERITAALERPKVAAELAAFAGPALAPESEYAERIVRRRERRGRPNRNRAAHAAHVEARERERVERAGTGPDIVTLARLYASGSSAELAAVLSRRGEL